jgi:hypothetical protein
LQTKFSLASLKQQAAATPIAAASSALLLSSTSSGSAMTPLKSATPVKFSLHSLRLQQSQNRPATASAAAAAASTPLRPSTVASSSLPSQPAAATPVRFSVDSLKQQQQQQQPMSARKLQHTPSSSASAASASAAATDAPMTASTPIKFSLNALRAAAATPKSVGKNASENATGFNHTAANTVSTMSAASASSSAANVNVPITPKRGGFVALSAATGTPVSAILAVMMAEIDANTDVDVDEAAAAGADADADIESKKETSKNRGFNALNMSTVDDDVDNEVDASGDDVSDSEIDAIPLSKPIASGTPVTDALMRRFKRFDMQQEQEETTKETDEIFLSRRTPSKNGTLTAAFECVVFLTNKLVQLLNWHIHHPSKNSPFYPTSQFLRFIFFLVAANCRPSTPHPRPRRQPPHPLRRRRRRRVVSSRRPSPPPRTPPPSRHPPLLPLPPPLCPRRHQCQSRIPSRLTWRSRRPPRRLWTRICDQR